MAISIQSLIIWYHFFDVFNIAFGYYNIPALASGHVARFPGVKMVLAGFAPDNLVILGYFKPFSGCFVGLYLRHIGLFCGNFN